MPSVQWRVRPEKGAGAVETQIPLSSDRRVEGKGKTSGRAEEGDLRRRSMLWCWSSLSERGSEEAREVNGPPREGSYWAGGGSEMHLASIRAQGGFRVTPYAVTCTAHCAGSCGG